MFKINLTKGEWFQIGLAALSVVGIGASTASSILSNRAGDSTVNAILTARDDAVAEIQEAYAQQKEIEQKE